MGALSGVGDADPAPEVRSVLPASRRRRLLLGWAAVTLWCLVVLVRRGFEWPAAGPCVHPVPSTSTGPGFPS